MYLMTHMCCCLSLGACCRLAVAAVAVILITKHTSSTGRDSWDTKGRMQPHGQIRIRRVGVTLREFLKGAGRSDG
jgi:hypothetical protein